MPEVGTQDSGVSAAIVGSLTQSIEYFQPAMHETGEECDGGVTDV
jgi:hypothetical protein